MPWSKARWFEPELFLIDKETRMPPMSSSSPARSEPVQFKGSFKVGYYNAQLFTHLAVTPESLTFETWIHSFRIDRENLISIDDRFILGFIRYGFQFRHRQPGLAKKVIFMQKMKRDEFLARLRELGWP